MNSSCYEMIILTGPDRGKSVSLSAVVDIGRGDDNDVPIADASISRKHARLAPSENGILVRDLGSRNKIVFGGRHVEECTVPVGGEFNLGNIRFKVLQGTETPESAGQIIPIRSSTVPVKLKEGSNAVQIFDPELRTRKARRRAFAALIVLGVVSFVALALTPILLKGPNSAVIDVIVEEGRDKAVAVWSLSDMVTRQNGFTVSEPEIAAVEIDSQDGFILKITGRKTGFTTASGINRDGGTTTLNIVVRARGDELWEVSAKPEAERIQVALYHLGLARDIESHSPYQAMRQYALAADIMSGIDPLPAEYAEAARREQELDEDITVKIEEHVRTYTLARRAGELESAARELRAIGELVSDPEDFRYQKARILARYLADQARKERK